MLRSIEVTKKLLKKRVLYKMICRDFRHEDACSTTELIIIRRFIFRRMTFVERVLS